jgi:hypothetical protein
MLRVRTLAIILIILGGGITGVTAELSTEHSVDIAGSMNIPAQTVETQWGEATITEIGKEESGENLEVSADAPENESYAIRIVDTEERNLETRVVDEGGDTETSFRLNRFDPGTYTVVLTQASGDTGLEVEPFIIKGYTVDQSVSHNTEGKLINVDIQLTPAADDPADPQAVNVTLFGDDVTRSVEATETGENSYQANFSTDGLPAGSYDIYTGIETSGDIYNYEELIGLSGSTSVTVEDGQSSTPTTTPEPTETDNIGGGSGVEDSETTSSTAEETSTETAQTSSSPVSTQSSVTESTQIKTQEQTSEPTAIETATQTQQPTSDDADSESEFGPTTSSEMPIFPSGGIIILAGMLIGILYRIHHLK